MNIKLSHNENEILECTKKYNVAFKLVADYGSAANIETDVWIPLNHAHADTKEELRTILHRDIDTFINQIND